MKQNPLQIGFTCPNCQSPCFFHESIKEIDSIASSTNCHNCGFLLLVDNGMVYDFHAKLHENDPRWPKDGKNTGSIVID